MHSVRSKVVEFIEMGHGQWSEGSEKRGSLRELPLDLDIFVYSWRLEKRNTVHFLFSSMLLYFFFGLTFESCILKNDSEAFNIFRWMNQELRIA